MAQFYLYTGTSKTIITVQFSKPILTYGPYFSTVVYYIVEQ